MARKHPKLTLHRETLRTLQVGDLQQAVGGAATVWCVETMMATLCDPPPWVSTSPPTHLCN